MTYISTLDILFKFVCLFAASILPVFNVVLVYISHFFYFDRDCGLLFLESKLLEAI